MSKSEANAIRTEVFSNLYPVSSAVLTANKVFSIRVAVPNPNTGTRKRREEELNKAKRRAEEKRGREEKKGWRRRGGGGEGEEKGKEEEKE